MSKYDSADRPIRQNYYRDNTIQRDYIGGAENPKNDRSSKVPAVVDTRIDFKDTNSLINYGVDKQRAVNSVSENILRSVRGRDVGPVADSLNQIVATIGDLKTSGLQKRQGLLARLIRMPTPIAKFLSSFESSIHRIDTIVSHLDSHRSSLSRSVAELDVLYAETETMASSLEKDITILKSEMDQFEQNVLPDLKQKAEENLLPMAPQEYNDARAAYDRADRKYINLKLTRQVSLQNLPSIRLTQEHDVALLEKINDIEVNTVPLWKRQLAIAIESAKTVGAGKAISAATAITNQMLIEGAAQLGQAQIEARVVVERGIIDIAAVEQANTTLIATITTVQSMVNEARTGRRETEQRIAQTEANLRLAITAQ